VKVLVLDQFSELGGAQTCLLMGLEAMRASGWAVAVGLPGEGDLFRRIRQLGFETFRISIGPYGLGRKSAADIGRLLWQSARLAIEIRTHLRRLHADLLYLNGPRLLPAAALAGVRIPVLFHAHNNIANPMIRRMAGETLRRLPAAVVACCHYVAEGWKSFVESGRVSVIFNGVAGSPELRRPHPSEPRHSSQPKIGCIGRISPEKGQMEFVAAAAAIHRSLPECRFTIYGAPLFSRDAVQYCQRVRAAACGLPIEFPGWATDVYKVLTEIDVLLVPSGSGEATTRVIPEAFAAGVPVIAFASGGIPEIVEHDRTGFLVRSTEEMAGCTIDLLSGSYERLCSISREARSAWETRFTPECFQLRLLEAMRVAARSFG
jgi:glycosyltransferase involved in cell wall biosynthesis